MAKLRINGDTSGYIEVSAPDIAGTSQITLPKSDPVEKTPSSDQVITAGNSTTTPLSVRSATGQTDNLFEAQDSSGNVLYGITSTGGITGTNGIGTFLRSSGTTQQAGTNGANVIYNHASITLTPGTWIVNCAGYLLNTVTTDSAIASIWNETSSSEITLSRGSPVVTVTTLPLTAVSCPVEVTVTTNTILRPYFLRNGGSALTVYATNIAGGVAAWITGIRTR